MLSLGCERLPTPLKKKKKKKKRVLDHYLHHDLGMLPLLGCFCAHLLILQYPDHHQNLISSSLYHSGPVHKISSQSVHNFLSNVVHRQTNKQTDKLTNATKNITSFAEEVTSFAKEVIKSLAACTNSFLLVHYVFHHFAKMHFLLITFKLKHLEWWFWRPGLCFVVKDSDGTIYFFLHLTMLNICHLWKAWNT